MILVLAVVGLVSGTSLAFMYKYAMPRIEKNQKEELKQAIFEVFAEAEDYEVITKEDKVFYKALGRGNKLLGYAFIAEGNGYQGNIKIMVGLKKDLKTLSGIKVLESVETPGLGGEITGEDFRKQFKNLSVSSFDQVQAITAATVSSKAVVKIINEKINETNF